MNHADKPMMTAAPAASQNTPAPRLRRRGNSLSAA
jgi:hypothetical protein